MPAMTTPATSPQVSRLSSRFTPSKSPASEATITLAFSVELTHPTSTNPSTTAPVRRKTVLSTSVAQNQSGDSKPTPRHTVTPFGQNVPPSILRSTSESTVTPFARRDSQRPRPSVRWIPMPTIVSEASSEVEDSDSESDVEEEEGAKKGFSSNIGLVTPPPPAHAVLEGTQSTRSQPIPCSLPRRMGMATFPRVPPSDASKTRSTSAKDSDARSVFTTYRKHDVGEMFEYYYRGEERSVKIRDMWLFTDGDPYALGSC